MEYLILEGKGKYVIIINERNNNSEIENKNKKNVYPSLSSRRLMMKMTTALFVRSIRMKEKKPKQHNI